MVRVGVRVRVRVRLDWTVRNERTTGPRGRVHVRDKARASVIYFHLLGGCPRIWIRLKTKDWLWA